MLNLSHKKLDVWKLSIVLVKILYKLTEAFPKNEIFGITNQIRRASVSIASNLAEGCARKSKCEKKRFFEIARSSLVEIDTQLTIALELNYMNKSEIEALHELFNKLFAKISILILNTK
ncbi:MAG: four helix bundle protein [Ignavibacteria bacterium]